MVATAPDANLYSDYYLDDLLTESALEETRLFFTELVKDDLPARNVVASDFAMLNDRMAAHYGIPGVYGSEFRRVAVRDEARRGLLGQAGILALTSHATRTSPVLRPAQRLVGRTPPGPGQRRRESHRRQRRPAV